jgi:hypothetical protein
MSTFWRTFNKLLDVALIKAYTYINAPNTLAIHDVVTAFGHVASQRLPTVLDCSQCGGPPPLPFQCPLSAFLWFCPGFKACATNNITIETYVWLLYDEWRPTSEGDRLNRFNTLQDLIDVLGWHDVEFKRKSAFWVKWSRVLREQEKELRVCRSW